MNNRGVFCLNLPLRPDVNYVFGKFQSYVVSMKFYKIKWTPCTKPGFRGMIDIKVTHVKFGKRENLHRIKLCSMTDQDQMVMDESLLKFYGGEVVQEMNSNVTHVVLVTPTKERLSYFQVYYCIEICKC